MRKTTKRRRARVGPATLTCAGTMLLALAAAAGCGGDDNGGQPPGGGGGDSGTPQGDAGPAGSDGGADTTQPPIDSGGDDGGTCSDNGGDLATVKPIAMGSAATFMLPLDAVPDTAGANVYFTAVAPDGTGGVFSVATGGSATPALLASGLGLPGGIALSDDGTKLFVVDHASPLATKDGGAIVTMGTSAGAPALLAGTDGYLPRGLAVSGNDVVFTGVDPANGKPGVFSVSTGGGNVSTLLEGAPLVDPTGIAAAGATAYVVDSIASGYHGTVFAITGGNAAAIASNVYAGYPAGLALTADGQTLLASSSIGAGGQLLKVPLGGAGGATSSVAPGAIGTSTEPAGLHRAHGGCAYAFVDSAAGGYGAVYLVTK